MNNKLQALLFIVIAATLISCGSKKKKTIPGGDGMNIQEFAAYFPVKKLPFIYGDSLFPQKENDSLLISAAIYNQFVPDSSIVNNTLGQTATAKFYPVARISNGTAETYLLARGIAANKKALFINVFDKDFKFIAGLPIIKIDKNTPVKQTVSIDPKFNISKVVTRQNPDGSHISGQDVYILNSATRQFMLIMTDSLGDAVGELINPIDTLSRKHKFAADYGTGKHSLISVRDGQRPGRISFFIRIQSEDKECMGELKGEATFTGENIAEYRQGGDPCILQFKFDAHKVSIKEVEGCGSRLGNLQCSFNGDYQRKKEPKKIVEKKGRKIETPKK